MRVLRALLKTGWLYALALWIYAAAVALAFPDRINEPLLLMSGLPRTDTSGAVAFGTSILCFVALQSLGAPGSRVQWRFRFVIDALLRACAFYGFLGWLYIAANVVLDPYTLPLRLTHFASRPTESQFGLGCFIVSALGSFAVWVRKSPGEYDEGSRGVASGSTKPPI